jgi:hypothetical protein
MVQLEAGSRHLYVGADRAMAGGAIRSPWRARSKAGLECMLAF